MKKYRRLTRQDRITVERRLEQGKKQIEIADELGVHRSSISREISRNKALHSRYRWRGAQAKAKCKRRDILFDYPRKIKGPLEELVMQLLQERFSPEQISNRLKLEEAKWSVSHETIYKWIYYIAPSFKKCLRWKSRVRQKRRGRYRRGLYKLPRKFIDDRPPEADLRAEPGHWERDLLIGLRSGPALLVIQDRTTRLTIIRKVDSRQCDEVNQTTAEALKGHIVKTVTNDNGVEFGQYEDLEKALGVPIYYCHAYTSWERGTVENTNGLLRQFVPKGYDFSKVTTQEIQHIEDKINMRPKKTLGYRSPTEVHRNITLKLIRSERFYREKRYKREEQDFKEDMVKAAGYYLN